MLQLISLGVTFFRLACDLLISVREAGCKYVYSFKHSASWAHLTFPFLRVLINKQSDPRYCLRASDPPRVARGEAAPLGLCQGGINREAAAGGIEAGGGRSYPNTPSSGGRTASWKPGVQAKVLPPCDGQPAAGFSGAKADGKSNCASVCGNLPDFRLGGVNEGSRKTTQGGPEGGTFSGRCRRHTCPAPGTGCASLGCIGPGGIAWSPWPTSRG